MSGHNPVLRLVLHLPFGHRELATPVRAALDLYLRNCELGPDSFSEYSLGEEPMALDEAGWEDIHDTLAPPPTDAFLDEETDKPFLQQKLKEQFDRTVELFTGPAESVGYGFFYWARLPWRGPPSEQVRRPCPRIANWRACSRPGSFPFPLTSPGAAVLPIPPGAGGAASSTESMDTPILASPGTPSISLRVLTVAWILATLGGLRLLDRQVLAALEPGLPSGALWVYGFGLVGALGLAALLRGVLVPRSSERWFRYGLGCAFWLVPAFFLPMFHPEDPARFFVLGALVGLFSSPLALAFPRDQASAMALHLAIVTAVLGSALLFFLLLPLAAEHIAFVFDQSGEQGVLAILGFAVLCLAVGHEVGRRAARLEPAYKGLVVGTTGGALLALLVRLLLLPFC